MNLELLRLAMSQVAYLLEILVSLDVEAVDGYLSISHQTIQLSLGRQDRVVFGPVRLPLLSSFLISCSILFGLLISVSCGIADDDGLVNFLISIQVIVDNLQCLVPHATINFNIAQKI